MATIANRNPSSEDEKGTLREIFALIAKDVSVGITTRDLQLALKSLRYNPTEAECQDLISLINRDDGNDDMVLYFSKLCSLMSTGSRYINQEQALREVFEVFDKDQSGRINAIELRRVMMGVGENITEVEASEMIRMLQPIDEHDEKNEEIDFEQFLLLLSS